MGRSGIRSSYEYGRGSVLMRGRARIETMGRDREAIIIDEIPYQVNKATMVEKIAELVRDKRVEGISDLRDESDRHGLRVVVELKRDANADVVLNQLYRYSPLQTSFGCNMVALNGGRPEQLNLKDLLSAFIAFREEVVARRTKFLLAKARDRAHVLVGLAVAVANIDEVIHLIRTAPDPASARQALMGRDWPAQDMAPLVALIDDPRHSLNADGTIRLSDEQARAILDLRLQRLTALGRDEISDELHKLADQIRDYLDILRSRARIQGIIKDELSAVRDAFATPRRTEIVEGGPELEDEDFINREDMVVTVSHAGYIKRVPLDTYRAQRRGGKGRAATSLREDDFVYRLFVANTHTPVLFFSSRGMVYKEKVWRLPLAAPQARGKALVNMLPLHEGERITSILPLTEDESSWGEYDVLFATRQGYVRRNKLSDFTNVNRAGKIAMKLDDDDGIVGVQIATPEQDVLLTTAAGQGIRFPVSSLRVFMGRSSKGVRGIALGQADEVISMSILRHVATNAGERNAYLKMRRAVAGEQAPAGEGNGEENGEAVELGADRYAEMSAAEEHIITISQNGYGKRTSAYEFRVTGRGGKGIAAMVVNERNGPLVASFPVEDSDQIMLVTNKGQLIRVPVDGVRIAGRNTQGVIVFDTAADERVVSVERISDAEDEEDEAQS
jgi:DNA gyrase subunit A